MLPSARSQRAALFVVGQAGDFVLALSAIRLLAARYGAERCTLILSDSAAPLAAREFPAVERLVIPADAASLTRHIIPTWRRARGRFAACQFDDLICLSHQRSLYYELAASWVHAGRDFRLGPATYPATPEPGFCTELAAHRQLLGTVLGRPVATGEILPAFTHLETSSDGRLLTFPFSRDPSRSLPPDILRPVWHLWRERSRAPIVLGGSLADASRLASIAAAARQAGLGEVATETPADFAGLLAQIARAGAVLSADSAPAHIATALDKPAVVMTSRAFYGYAQPWTRSARQQVFVQGTPPDRLAAALPAL